MGFKFYLIKAIAINVIGRRVCTYVPTIEKMMKGIPINVLVKFMIFGIPFG